LYCENQQFCTMCYHYIILHYNLHRQSFRKIWMYITTANLIGRSSVQSKGSSYMKVLFGQSNAATGSLRVLRFPCQDNSTRADTCLHLSINDGKYSG
jgi:hypothetical protein